MLDKNSAIAVFDQHEQAEDAVKQLQRRLRYEEAVDRLQGLSDGRECRRLLHDRRPRQILGC